MCVYANSSIYVSLRPMQLHSDAHYPSVLKPEQHVVKSAFMTSVVNKQAQSRCYICIITPHLPGIQTSKVLIGSTNPTIP